MDPQGTASLLSCLGLTHWSLSSCGFHLVFHFHISNWVLHRQLVCMGD